MISPRRTRVTFLAGNLADGGGVNRVVRDLASLFARELRWEVKVIGIGTTDEPTYPFPDEVSVERGSRTTQVGWADALRSLRRDKPEFVIGSWTQSNLVLIVAMLFSKTKVIAVEHGSWHFHPRWVRLLRRLIYPFAWRVVVVNERELAHYRPTLRHVYLIPNPVAGAAADSRPKDEKIIIAIGHLRSHKNFADAIKAMALSGLEQSGWSLEIIGCGPERPQLLKMIDDCGLERTRIHPPISDIADWYGKASLIVVTSKLEVFSLVLAEAISAGVIPIAYDADGPSFILQDFPQNLVELGNVEEFARRMREVANSGVSQSTRTALRSSIAERFAPDRVLLKWVELLNGESAVDGFSPASPGTRHEQ